MGRKLNFKTQHVPSHPIQNAYLPLSPRNIVVPDGMPVCTRVQYYNMYVISVVRTAVIGSCTHTAVCICIYLYCYCYNAAGINVSRRKRHWHETHRNVYVYIAISINDPGVLHVCENYRPCSSAPITITLITTNYDIKFKKTAYGRSCVPPIGRDRETSVCASGRRDNRWKIGSPNVRSHRTTARRWSDTDPAN